MGKGRRGGRVCGTGIVAVGSDECLSSCLAALAVIAAARQTGRRRRDQTPPACHTHIQQPSSRAGPSRYGVGDWEGADE